MIVILWCPLQELGQSVKAHQSDVDRFSDEGQLLAQTTSEGRVSTYVQQMSARYQALITSTKVSQSDILHKQSLLMQFNVISAMFHSYVQGNITIPH